MPPLSIHIPPLFRPHSRNNSQTNLHARSRANSIDSINDERIADGHSLPYIQRWNGHTREATTWSSLRRDSELFFPSGNCLIYLYSQGASRRGPSFRMPYDFLLYSACRPLVERALLTSLQSPVYHPGSNTPPSYENLHDPSATDHTYLSLYLDAPASMNQEEAFMYHITTRNFFAWLVGAPLVGRDPVSALIDLKVRMDEWRDAGADNYTALQQYVKEQSYDDYDEMETRVAREHRFGVEPDQASNTSSVGPQAPSEISDAKDIKRGRRGSFSASVRSTSSRLRRKFSRSRKPKEDMDSESGGVPPVPPTPNAVTSPAVVASMPKNVSSRPPSSGKGVQAKSSRPATASSIMPEQKSNLPPEEPAAAQKLTKRASFANSMKRRLSWVAGPLRPSDEPDPMPATLPNAFKGPSGPPPGMGPPTSEPNPLPYRLTLQTQQLPKPEGYQSPQSAPMLNTTKNYSRPDLGRSLRGSAVNSQTSVGNHGIYLDQHGRERCECCGKLVKRPSMPTLGSSAAAGPSGSGTQNVPISPIRPPPMSNSRRSSASSLISAAAYALPPSIAVSHEPNMQSVPPIPRSRPSSFDQRSVHAATPVPTTTSAPIRQLDSAIEAKRIQADRIHRVLPAKEIVVPDYGNGLESPTASMDSAAAFPNDKGKERESLSSIQRDRYTTSASTYGLVTTPGSSSGFSGLPELEFSRSTPSIKSADTGSFTSAQPPASTAPSFHTAVPASTRPASTAGSLHGQGDGGSFYSLVTSPHKHPAAGAPPVAPDNQRPSVDGLLKELEIAGISGPSFGLAGNMSLSEMEGMQDEDERMGVGNMRTLGLRAS